MDFSDGGVVKNLPANAGEAGEVGSISSSERSPGRGNGQNSLHRGTRQAAVHGAAEGQTRLST